MQISEATRLINEWEQSYAGAEPARRTVNIVEDIEAETANKAAGYLG